MYKEIIISIVIVVTVVIINSISQDYTDKIIEEKREELYELKEKTKNIVKNSSANENEVFEKSSEILKQWKEQYYLLAIYLEHDELEKVEKELVSLKANADVKNYEEVVEDIDMCIFALEHLKDKEVLNVDNFF